jgi:hypothetical protein
MEEVMAAALDHFTTWDDPRLWERIIRLVTVPALRLAGVHQLETWQRAAGAAAGAPFDITEALHQQGIPTANARVLASYDLEHHSLHVFVRRGGVDWKGTLTLTITRD